MIRTATCFMLSLLALPALADVNNPRVDTNFGFGGATTYSENATDLFAPTLGPVIRSAGLDLIGLSQQVDFANAILGDVDSQRDVFWVWAGTNNILIDSIMGTSNSARAADDLVAVLEDLYMNQGARIFVVPNLMLLGNIPQFNTTEESRNGINFLTQVQNDMLADALDDFSRIYRDAKVIDLDVQSLFTELETSSSFDNTTESCFTTGLPNGLSCEKYLYADDIHFSSAAAGKIAELAASELADIDVRRFVTFGDSFVDTGSLSDTTIRTLGISIPAAPSFEGRFSDGLNVIDQVEQLLGVEVATNAFVQPSRLALEVFGSSDLTDPVDVIVPNKITLSEPVYFFSNVKIKFGNKGTCFYWPESFFSDTLSAQHCSRSLQPGETVTTDDVSTRNYYMDSDLTLDLFFY